jgi:hypothetical protein
MWKLFDHDRMEFTRGEDGRFEGRIYSLTYTCYRHGVHVPEARGECFICGGCGRDYSKRIFPAYTVLTYRSKDPMRIRAALKRAREMPIPSTVSGDHYMEFDLDEGEAAESSRPP